MIIVVFKGNENIALLRPAYQSSTLYSNVASRGVDGRDAHKRKAATGSNDYNPWWKVKLSYPTWINQVEIVMDIGEQLVYISWWRHQMEAFSVLLAICAGNSSVNSPHKGQWRGASMSCFICAWINHQREKLVDVNRRVIRESAVVEVAHSVYMMTSSNGNIFRVTGPCAGNSPVPGEFPSRRPVTRSFDIFFDLRLNTRLSKQTRCRWFETSLRSLWRHCNVSGVSMCRYYH